MGNVSFSKNEIDVIFALFEKYGIKDYSIEYKKWICWTFDNNNYCIGKIYQANKKINYQISCSVNHKTLTDIRGIENYLRETINKTKEPDTIQIPKNDWAGVLKRLEALEAKVSQK